jgi:hypothetical protein
MQAEGASWLGCISALSKFLGKDREYERVTWKQPLGAWIQHTKQSYLGKARS